MREPALPDFRQHLVIETPEHVVLDYELAGIGSRLLATLADVLLSALIILVAAMAVSLSHVAQAWGTAWATLLIFSLNWGYSAFFEGLRQGQTPGKRWLGIRTMRDTGHPVTFAEAAARALLKPLDVFGAIGIILIMVHPRGKRLGDMVAGTVVVRDQPMAIGTTATFPGATTDSIAGAPLLGDDEFHLVRGFVQRLPDLPVAAAERLAQQLATRFAGYQSGPAVPPRAFLEQLHRDEVARRQGQFGARVSSAHGKGSVAERLVARKSARWDEFQRLAERVTAHGLDSLEAKELPDFAARYREVAADLARAQTYRADAGVRGRIERLVAAGHNALYREERRTWSRIWQYLTRDCPAEIVASWRPLLLGFSVFAIPATGGYLLLREQPAIAAQIIPDGMLERAEAGVSRQANGEWYVRVSDASLPAMAAQIIVNNIGVAFNIFASGIAFGIGSLVLLAFNGLSLGTTYGHFANVGLGGYLGAFVVGHGVLELFALWVAGAAGFLLGSAIIMPGDLPRGDAMALAGQRAMRLVAAVVFLLVIAGTIEGFVSAGGYPLRVRLTVSAASTVFLLIYIGNGGLALLRRGRTPGGKSLPAR